MQVNFKARETFHLEDLVGDIKAVLPGWAEANLENVSFSRLTGLTNVTFKVTCKDPKVNPSTVVYRQFGEATGFFDHDTEHYIFQAIGEVGLGPKYYHKNDVFRLEEFIDGEHPASLEFGSFMFRRLMMKYISEFHLLTFEKLEKTPKILHQIELGKIFEGVYEELRDKESKTESDKKILEDVELIVKPEEIEFFKSIFPTRDGSVAFCHNDLNNLNVFKLNAFSKESGMPKLIFIDLEYAGYDFVGRDIGNYLHEPTFSYGLPSTPYFKYLKENFPERDELEKLAAYYLIFRYLKKISYPSESLEEILPKIVDQYEVALKFIKEVGIDMEAFEKERVELTREIKVGELICNWYWTLWAVKMSKQVNMQFDYMEYASVKLEVYKQLRAQYRKEYL